LDVRIPSVEEVHTEEILHLQRKMVVYFQ